MKLNRLFLSLSNKRKQKAAKAKSLKRSVLGGSIAMLAASAMTLSTLSTASAATFYWDVTGDGDGLLGGAAGGTWSNGVGAFWDPTGLDAPANNAAWINSPTSIAVFSGAAGPVTLGTAINVGAVTITTSGYTIAGGGNTLTISGTGYSATSSAPVGIVLSAPASSLLSTVISANIALGSSQNWSADLFNSLASSGTISDSGPGYGIGKTGKGRLELSGVNTYTGQLSVMDGTLVIRNATALGLGGTSIQAGGDRNTFGGTLQLAAANPFTGLSTARNFVLTGGGVATANSITTGIQAITQGALTSVGNNTISGSVTFSALGAEQRISSASGNLTLAGNVTLGVTGAAAVADTLFYGPGNFNVTGAIQANAGRLIKTGAGTLASTLVLSNAANAFSGTIRIDSGTVRVANGGALGTSVASNAIDINTGTLEVRTDSTNVPSFLTKNVSTVSSATTGVL